MVDISWPRRPSQLPAWTVIWSSFVFWLLSSIRSSPSVSLSMSSLICLQLTWRLSSMLEWDWLNLSREARAKPMKATKSIFVNVHTNCRMSKQWVGVLKCHVGMVEMPNRKTDQLNSVWQFSPPFVSFFCIFPNNVEPISSPSLFPKKLDNFYNTQTSLHSLGSKIALILWCCCVSSGEEQSTLKNEWIILKHKVFTTHMSTTEMVFAEVTVV